jgi:hypothetical protein
MAALQLLGYTVCTGASEVAVTDAHRQPAVTSFAPRSRRFTHMLHEEVQ